MLIFAHRGASADAPENTLLAIEKALEQEADGIEVDVHQLNDELVIIHDRWVSRTTNGNRLLTDYTTAELFSLDAGQGQSIPTLWQVLQKVNGRCRVNIEIKGVQDVTLIKACIAKALTSLNFEPEQFLVSSFDHHILDAFKKIAPAINIGALTASNPIHYARFAEDLQAYSVNADVSFINRAFVDDSHSRGIKVFVYTVDQPRDLLNLQAWGVDGVFCNAPAKAKKVLSR